MSEKTAKAQRREQIKSGQIVHRLQAIAYADGSIRLEGVPMDYHIAMSLVFAIIESVNGIFIKGAKDGRLDDNGRLSKPLIQTPEKRILM